VRAPAWLDVLVLTGVALALRTAWLTVPRGVHIFDEAYYVQDARVILGLPVKAHDLPQGALSFLDPNREHPPLAKLFMSLFMYLLGDNPWGQRSASVFFGTLSVPLVYMIVRRFGGKHGVGLLSAYFVAFDNLSFVHSRIATLDVFYVFFILCAVYAYAGGLIELAGAALALSTTCKITGLFGFATLLGFEVVKGALEYRATRELSAAPFKNFLVLTAWYVGGTLILLGALDASFTRFATPIAHIKHILEFGSRLTHEVPQGAESVPWQWLINEVQIPYAETREMRGDLYRVTSQFRGATNPYLIFFAPIGLTFAAARALKQRDALALLCVAMFFGTHAPYWYLWYHSHRICYLYYFLPTVPAIAMANALVVHELRPQIARTAYVAAIAFGMWTYFPFNDFPPHEPPEDAPQGRPMQPMADRKDVAGAEESAPATPAPARTAAP
jgi:predicted membrane-bound dolichyl-phosphate-mannose-protein mannosyltransferase